MTMIASITWNCNLVPLLASLCSWNPCKFDFSVLWVFAGINIRTNDLQIDDEYGEDEVDEAEWADRRAQGAWTLGRKVILDHVEDLIRQHKFRTSLKESV